MRTVNLTFAKHNIHSCIILTSSPYTPLHTRLVFCYCCTRDIVTWHVWILLCLAWHSYMTCLDTALSCMTVTWHMSGYCFVLHDIVTWHMSGYCFVLHSLASAPSCSVLLVPSWLSDAQLSCVVIYCCTSHTIAWHLSEYCFVLHSFASASSSVLSLMPLPSCLADVQLSAVVTASQKC